MKKQRKKVILTKKMKDQRLKKTSPQKTWVKTDETKRNERNDIRNF